MRGKKAKELRRLSKALFAKLPVREYKVIERKDKDGVIRQFHWLMVDCQHKRYKLMKRFYKNFVGSRRQHA